MAYKQMQKQKQKTREKLKKRQQNVSDCDEAGRTAAWCQKGSKKHAHATDDDESETIEETPDNDEQLQAWCLVENGKMSSGKK